MLDQTPETALLAAVILSRGNCFDDVTATGDDFHNGTYGALFDDMRREWDNGRPVDQMVLAERHPDQAALIWNLTSSSATAAQATVYADLVRKAAIRRRLQAFSSSAAGFDADMTADELADAARGLVDKIVGGDAGRKLTFIADVLPDLEADMRRGDVFVPTPWPELDDVIGGFRPGALYVVGARPGQGKTVLAGQIAATLQQHGPVAFSSLEMTAKELTGRFMSERLSINVGHIKDSRMNDRDWQTLEHGRDRLAALNIAIDDRSGVTPSDVRGFVRTISRRGKLAGVIVDYLQLMTSRERLDRHLQVADFSRRLKILAKDFNVPVIVLSQLNRESEKSALGIPKLSDLRESGAIEQDADVVMLLRREGLFPNETLVVDVAKNRHGSTGEVMLAWDGGYSRATGARA